MKRPDIKDYMSGSQIESDTDRSKYMADLEKYVDHLEAQQPQDWPDVSPSHAVVKYNGLQSRSGTITAKGYLYYFDELQVVGNKLLLVEYLLNEHYRIKHIIDIDLHNIRFEQ